MTTTTDSTTSSNRATEVAHAGEKLGFWTVLTSGNGYTNTVMTPEGFPFYIAGGGWGKTKEVTITLNCLNDLNNLQVSPRDAGGYNTVAPTASASASKSAEMIAKDFNRRVIQKPETRELAQKMLDRMTQLQGDCSVLRARVSTLEKMGYTFNNIKSNETYSAEGHSSFQKPRSVKVYGSGKVVFEVECCTDAMTEIIKVLN